ncbi:MAG: HAD-IB family phosphatase [Bacteroidia bacterium]|jgi:HAD superfamily hydrolase (TIGR01490 family)|nr:HAD-IB family phosphatase [Bacteroidia bacterium]
MVKLALFDFDKTLYRYDCTQRFYLFLIKSNLRFAAHMHIHLIAFIGWRLKLISTQKFKSIFLSYLTLTSPSQLQKYIDAFWDNHRKYFNDNLVKEWKRLINEGCRIIIITASPEILVKAAFINNNNLEIIGTTLTFNENKLNMGINCKGYEKINRLNQQMKEPYRIVAAYSDSASDLPMMNLAEQGFWVRKNQLIPFIKQNLNSI